MNLQKITKFQRDTLAHLTAIGPYDAHATSRGTVLVDVIDSAPRGGRCLVTHELVTPTDLTRFVDRYTSTTAAT